MKERPILFSCEMVRAILEGRKTQTRRVIKSNSNTSWLIDGNWSDNYVKNPENLLVDDCPYGQSGDRLWARETWIPDPPHDDTWDFYSFSDGHLMNLNAIPRRYKNQSHVIYKSSWGNLGLKWRPSIFMPRWASRITLEITDVRVERLQDISESDAEAEGTTVIKVNISQPGFKIGDPLESYRDVYSYLWNKINGEKYPWESNPWVWVIEFKRVEA